MAEAAVVGTAVQQTLDVEIIRQHSGVQTSARRVKVSVPGKFFPQLQPAEQKAFYEGEAVEYRERYKLIFMFFYREN
jgi:hypothetical protein